MRIKEFLKENANIIFIFVIAVLVRTLFLTFSPPALNWDEISHGYNSYSILKTGRDEWGKLLPIIFRAYGDYKLPVYIYLTAISELIFGLNPFAVRLVSVLAGIGTVVFTYLLTRRLFQNKLVSTLSSILVIFEPWTFFLGRPAFEANLALFLFVAAVYFLVKALQERHLNSLGVGIVFFGLTVWTYNSYRIFTPLFMFATCVIYKNELLEIIKNKKAIKKISLLIVVLFLPMFYQLVTNSGSARYSKVSILDEGAINKINEQRAALNLSDPFPRLLANKVTYFGKEFVINYFKHFTPGFLFLKGGTNYQFSIPEQSLLFIIDLPFIIWGFVFLLRQKSKESRLVLIWLLLGPVASSVTREAPHVLRSITMLPIPMILAALGVFRFAELLKRKKIERVWFWIFYILLLFLFFEKYILNYFGDYRTKYSWSWQYGYKEAAQFIREHSDNYARIVISKKYGEPHEFLLFYLKYNPNSYNQNKNLNRFYQSGWYWVDSFDKFYFVNDWDIPKEGYKFIQESKRVVDCRQAKCLLITSPNNAPKNWSKIETIYFLDGQPAFELYANY